MERHPSAPLSSRYPRGSYFSLLALPSKTTVGTRNNTRQLVVCPARRLQEGTVRALILCPEEPKYKGFSSILWGSLQDTDTLVFLRTAGGRLCVTPDAQRDIVVLGTISLSRSLGLTQQVRVKNQGYGT